MKKRLLTAFMIASVSLSAQTYTGVGSSIGESKKDACQKALEFAKSDAMEQAGTMVLSSFSSNTSDNAGDVSSSTASELKTVALGITKLQDKTEKVTVDKNYLFSCEVNAVFSIDRDEMKEAYKKAIKDHEQEKVLSGYYEAEGYSEEGQSRYRAFTSATLVAQRNLLEQIQKANITSLTKLENGQLDDKMAKLLKGSIQGAKVVKKEYDRDSKYAHIVLRLSKQEVHNVLHRQ